MGGGAPNLANMTIPQLLQALSAGQAGSPMHQQATIMLQFRVAERQAEAAAAMVAPTQALASFTRGLARATWALVFFGGATLLLTLVQVLKALGVLR